MPPAAKSTMRGLWGDWNQGRLTPLLFGLFFAVAMAGAYLFSFAYMAIFETTPDSRGAGSLTGPLGLPLTREGALWLSFSLLALFGLGGANVMAKRIRDMGLPGGLATCMLGIMMLVFLGGGDTLQWATNLFVFSVFVALLGIPTDHLEAGSGRTAPPNDG